MRQTAKKFVLATVAVALVMISFVSVQAATRASLRGKLERAAGEPVREFFYADFNGDGKKEAVAVTSNGENEFGYVGAKVWYISSEGCDVFYESGEDYLYDGTLKLYKLDGTNMLCFNVGAGGSGYVAYAWVFDKKGPKAVENVMAGVKQLKDNEFVILDDRYDGAVDGTGHTWNQYFAKWDGEKLVEYGGLKISTAQLKKTKNGAKILKEVKAYGTVQSIYYRANGMVFINLCDGSQNRNVALTLKNGKLSYYDYGDGGTGGETALEKATADGIIRKSITTCVTYPKKFPVE